MTQLAPREVASVDQLSCVLDRLYSDEGAFSYLAAIALEGETTSNGRLYTFEAPLPDSPREIIRVSAKNDGGLTAQRRMLGASSGLVIDDRYHLVLPCFRSYSTLEFTEFHPSERHYRVVSVLWRVAATSNDELGGLVAGINRVVTDVASVLGANPDRKLIQ